jgi:hypothetical protein
MSFALAAVGIWVAMFIVNCGCNYVAEQLLKTRVPLQATQVSLLNTLVALILAWIFTRGGIGAP